MSEHLIILDDNGHAVCRRPVSSLPTSGMNSVAHGATLTGAGTTASPLDVVPSAIAGDIAAAIAGTNLTYNATTHKLDAASGGGGSTPADATETVKGIVELATTAEAAAGTDTTHAVTPAGVKSYFDAKLGDFSSLPVCS